jgi:hypothetical protein
MALDKRGEGGPLALAPQRTEGCLVERVRAIAADPLAGPRQRPAGRDRRLEADPLGDPVADQPLADPGGEVVT